MYQSNMSIEKIFEGIDKFHIEQKRNNIPDYSVMQLTGIDFSGQTISDVDLSCLLFDECNFSNANFNNVYIYNTQFNNCNLNGTVFCEPTSQKAVFPVFSNCITNKKTVMPTVFQYKEMVGYTVLENTLMKVLVSGNLTVDIDESTKRCYSAFIKVIEIINSNSCVNKNIKENEVLNAIDFDVDEFTIFASEKDALLYGSITDDKEKIYSYDTVPFIKCKDNIDYDNFMKAVCRYLNFHDSDFIVIQYNNKNQIIRKVE